MANADNEFDRIAGQLIGNAVDSENDEVSFSSRLIVFAGALLGAFVAGALRVAIAGLGIYLIATSLERLVNNPEHIVSAMWLSAGAMIVWIIWPPRP